MSIFARFKMRRRNQRKLSSEQVLHNKNTNLVFLIKQSTNRTGLWMGPSGVGVHWMARIATFSFLSSIILIMISIFLSRHDTEVVFESFSVLTFCFMGALKLNSLRGGSKRWLFLLSQVESLERQLLNIEKDPIDYESDDENDENDFSTHIKKYTNKFRSTSALITKFYNATLIIFVCSPFAEYGLSKLRGIDTGYPHILPEWAPLDGISIFGYIATTVTFEVIACVYCVIVHVAFDLTSVGLMIFVCGQFALLREYSERIGGSGKVLGVSNERDARAHFRIIKCHRIHMILVNSIMELDKLMKNILGIYFYIATLTLCTVAVRLNSQDLGVMELVSLLQYTCGVLTQLYLFCYFADAVLHESSVGTGEGPFVVSSWCLRPRVRRELHLLSIGMAKPWRLRAGPFNSLNLPSFVQIVRTAYSYYAVLRK